MTAPPPLASAADSQLIIIDLQPRLAAAMAAEEREKVFRQSAILAKAAHLLGIPTLVTEQYAKGLGPTDPVIAEALSPETLRIDKSCFSCCGSETFLREVESRQRRQLLLAGMESHVCVLQTALDLAGRGFQVFVAEDATCSRNPLHRANAMERLRHAGIIVTNSESIIFEWLRDASHPYFKAVSTLVK